LVEVEVEIFTMKIANQCWNDITKINNYDQW